MREIGGYMELEHFHGPEYHGSLVAVNSGRNALHYIVKAKNIRKLYIPYFLCDAVYNLCEDQKIPYSRYYINEALLPGEEIVLQDGEWLYVVNYYGQLTDGQILALKQKYDRIIVDNVMDFFRKPLPGVDAVYSCRKFFGVADGGYAATDSALAEALPSQDAHDRMQHLLGRFETSGSAYYGQYHHNEEYIDHMPLKQMSLLSRNIMRAVDYDRVIRRRNENYGVLEAKLGKWNEWSFQMPEGPFCYPFYCSRGAEIRKKLAEQRIYVPTLWPNVLEDCPRDSLEYQLAQNILPIPCDQRYEAEDMMHIFETIHSIFDAM